MLGRLGCILWAFSREASCSDFPFRKITMTALWRIDYDVKAGGQMGGYHWSPQGRQRGLHCPGKKHVCPRSDSSHEKWGQVRLRFLAWTARCMSCLSQG